jgi:hypothetical protein
VLLPTQHFRGHAVVPLHPGQRNDALDAARAFVRVGMLHAKQRPAVPSREVLSGVQRRVECPAKASFTCDIGVTAEVSHSAAIVAAGR